jgi:hypothetical protein
LHSIYRGIKDIAKKQKGEVKDMLESAAQGWRTKAWMFGQAIIHEKV